MVTDNIIIHDRSVGEWKALAMRNNRPCGTAEELGRFIDECKAAQKADYFNPLRQAYLEDMTEELERDVLAILQELEEMTCGSMTASQLEYIHNELPAYYFNTVQVVNVKRYKV